MRLRTLEAQFIRREVRPCADPDCSVVSSHTEHEVNIVVDMIAEADGIEFLCPKCFAANGSDVGTHWVICWFEGKVPDDVSPKPGRWNPVGSSLDDLTFVPGAKSNSVLLLGGCDWHGFVTNGDAT